MKKRPYVRCISYVIQKTNKNPEQKVVEKLILFKPIDLFSSNIAMKYNNETSFQIKIMRYTDGRHGNTISALSMLRNPKSAFKSGPPVYLENYVFTHTH